jgi:hypothetical protein
VCQRGRLRRLHLQEGDLPRSDVVVLPVHTSDELLDGVPIVVQNEDDWGQLVGHHSR